MNPTIIIGAGMAGFTVARELRKLDKDMPLLIVTSDTGGYYSKPMLSNAFAQKKEAAQLVTQSAEQMALQLNAQILASTHVHGIDTAARTITTDAATHAYENLVLAVGAQPIRLAIAGDGADAVLSVNHVADYARFRDLVALPEHGASARVTILGAGLIGCEFADDLAGAGHAVTLIDPCPLPMAALAAPALSRGLQEALAKRGVVMKLGTTASRIDRNGDNLEITLADGSRIETDIVLSAVGLRPDLTVARAAGLAAERGILVDATGMTSAEHVYAVGDCAEYTVDAKGGTRILPYIAPLMAAARAIARTLTGTPTAIDLKDAPVIVKTPSYPIALVPPPLHALAGGKWEDEQTAERLICRFRDAQGVLVGFCVAPQDAASRNALLAALGTQAGAAAGT
jgi:rubredoxin-NAD+ reductase